LVVTFHGVRGSTPCHGSEIVRFGGNTSCVSVAIPDHDPILFDLGTGLRYFGEQQPGDRPFHGSCLLSHLHWDHIQGLPFFTPLLQDGAEVQIYAPMQDDGISVEKVFAETIKPPLFPIHYSLLPGTVVFHEVEDTEFTIGDADVMARAIPHIGRTVGYRLTWEGASVAYLSDHQMPPDGSFRAEPGAMELCAGVDLLIHDAQYTTAEFARKRDWGHCTVEYAVWLASEAGVGTLALFHHDPSHHDDMMDILLGDAVECGRKLGVDVIAAREGLRINVDS
jgi:phosphoribosyl 1,2-cyclic phosphodiesterase